MLIPYRGKIPRIHETTVITEGTYVCGDVTIGRHASVWFGASIRGDLAPVSIGDYSNVQDCAVIHSIPGKPVTIGSHTTIGHGAIVHAAEIGNAVLIGMNATVLDGAVVRDGAVVAAGCVVTPGTVVEPNTLFAGVPGKPIKNLGEHSAAERIAHANDYAELAKDYA